MVYDSDIYKTSFDLSMPVIKGTKVSLKFILQKLSAGCSTDDIIRSFPEITKTNIYACLEYASEGIEKVFESDKKEAKALADKIRQFKNKPFVFKDE